MAADGEALTGYPVGVDHDGPAGSRVVDLPCEVGSVPAARRFVRQVLSTLGDQDVVDAAEICVTELVTNVVLHARTDVQVRVAVRPDAVRLEVHDGSPMEPRRLTHTVGAATGRGLDLVALLAGAWGVDRLDDHTKAVWCEVPRAASAPAEDEPGGGTPTPEHVDSLLERWVDLPAGPGADDDAPGTSAARAAGETAGAGGAGGARGTRGRGEAGETAAAAVEPMPRGDLLEVVLRGYPVRLGLRVREHTSALLRECALLSHAPSTSAPARLVALAQQITATYAGELASVEQQRADALARGDRTVDLRYLVPSDSRQVIENWRAVVVELDRYAAGPSLLTRVTPPDLVPLRDWTLAEFTAQLDGAPPTPWTGPVD